MSAQRKFFDV